MKKKYEKPTIQKIAFNYRDQVVAASAGEIIDQAGSIEQGTSAWDRFYNSLPSWGKEIIDAFFELFG